MPAQWGCGTTCGAVGLGQHRARALTGAMKQLPGGDSKDRLEQGISRYIAFVEETCSKGRVSSPGDAGCKDSQEEKEEL